jgi:hypothetical protein
MARIIGVFALVVFGAMPLFAQTTFPPASFKNLQVLPKDAPAGVVIGTMKGFANALGVRCQFCHVGKEGMPLDAAVPRAAGVEARVTCITSHRGQSTPTATKVP